VPADDDAGLKARVRRVTYELGPIFEDEPDGDVGAAAGGRQYPWEPGRTSNMTCYLTDAEWLLEDLKNGETLDRLPMDKARFRVRSDGTELNRLDLMIDFVAGGAHREHDPGRRGAVGALDSGSGSAGAR
jgi:hypothetical protein